MTKMETLFPKLTEMAEVVSLDFVRAKKHTIASLREDLGQVLAAQRLLIDRKKSLLDLIWYVECDLPVTLYRGDAPVDLAALAPKPGNRKNAFCASVWRRTSTT